MTITIKSNKTKFEFRQPNDNDTFWIIENYSTDNKPNGIENHLKIMGDFENGYQAMVNATMHLMFRLNIDNYPDVQSFIAVFGTDIKAAGLLVHTLQRLLGGTQKDVDIHLKYIEENKKLKKNLALLRIDNTRMKIQINKFNKKKQRKNKK